MSSRTAVDDSGHELAMQLRAAYSHLRRSSNVVFSTFGMSSDQFVLLTVLAREGQVTQQELVRLCFSDTATIGTMVSLLERKRLLKRRPNPQDRRAWRVTLTAAGRRLAIKMRRSSSGIRGKLVAAFDDREVRILLRLLKRVAEVMRPERQKAVLRDRRNGTDTVSQSGADRINRHRQL